MDNCLIFTLNVLLTLF